MLPLVRVSLGLLLSVIFTGSLHSSIPTGGILARSVVKRALPQFMDYDQSGYQQPSPHHERRTHIVKIHPKKTARSNDPVLSDVTNFRGIGEDHNAFGGPKYAGQYYPLVKDQGDHARASNFSFGNLLSGLALWNLANEFNMYSSQDKAETAPNVGQSIGVNNNQVPSNQYDALRNNTDDRVDRRKS